MVWLWQRVSEFLESWIVSAFARYRYVAGEVEGQSFCGYYFIDISLVISSALALVIL